MVFLRELFIDTINSISKFCTQNRFSGLLLEGLLHEQCEEHDINQCQNRLRRYKTVLIYLNQIQYNNWTSISVDKVLKVKFGCFIPRVLPWHCKWRGLLDYILWINKIMITFQVYLNPTYNIRLNIQSWSFLWPKKRYRTTVLHNRTNLYRIPFRNIFNHNLFSLDIISYTALLIYTSLQVSRTDKNFERSIRTQF